jgi:hypothetical protein
VPPAVFVIDAWPTEALSFLRQEERYAWTERLSGASGGAVGSTIKLST